MRKYEKKKREKGSECERGRRKIREKKKERENEGRDLRGIKQARK